MEFNRFKKIIDFNRAHREEISGYIKQLYRQADMEYSLDFLNVMQVIRPLFQKKRYIVFEIPLEDKEIGALYYSGDGLGYLFLNSSLPKVNVNFALCHEIYHVFFNKKQFNCKIELYMSERYFEDEEELAANAFAGMLLMPEHSFCNMFRKFSAESNAGDSKMTCVVKLMSYFEVPYMAALIRCYELDLLESGSVMRELLSISQEQIETEFTRLWLDETILSATKRDDFSKLHFFVKKMGKIYSEKELLSERTIQRALTNMTKIYQEIRE